MKRCFNLQIVACMMHFLFLYSSSFSSVMTRSNLATATTVATTLLVYWWRKSKHFCLDTFVGFTKIAQTVNWASVSSITKQHLHLYPRLCLIRLISNWQSVNASSIQSNLWDKSKQSNTQLQLPVCCCCCYLRTPAVFAATGAIQRWWWCCMNALALQWISQWK